MEQIEEERLIYADKNKVNTLINQYKGAEKDIREKIAEFEERFNKDPNFAEFCDYKIFMQSIKEVFYFEHPIKEIPNKYLKILKDKELFNKITIDELDKKIVREVPTRRVIFLCASGRLVKNCQVASYNLLINDEAGTGKDYVTGKTLDILPKEIYIKKTRISPTVFTYWHNAKYEPDWSWDGKVFYTEDINENVLNSEVFKVMCSSGSEATIVIKQRAIDISIEGKPVIITTTANSIPNAELVRRFEILNLDESIDQTKEIMKKHCEYAINGLTPDYNQDYTESLRYLKRVNVLIPFAEKLYLLFPSSNITMRTKFPRFLDFIKASASFHQFQRKQDKEGNIFAEKQDYELACEIMGKLISNKYLVSLTKKQKTILEEFEKETEQDPNFRATASKIRELLNNFISLPALITNLSQLTSYGLLKVKLEEDSRSRESEFYYLNKNILKDSEQIIFPKFEELKQLK